MANEQKEDILLKFDVSSEDNSINAKSASKSIESLASLIQETHQEFQQNSKLLIKTRPFSQGSFEIPLEIILTTEVDLLEIPILENIVAVIKKYFDTKILLKGEMPDYQTHSLSHIQRGIEILERHVCLLGRAL